jgi:MFS family permease
MAAVDTVEIGGGAPPTTGQAGPAVRHVAAVVAGNGLAFYDFLSYAYFAAQIGRALFPAGGEGMALLESLATFGVGFLMRPVGALVIGRIADRTGRRPAMLLSFALMGAAMVGLALTPPFAAIGWAAPTLAVAFRLLQGFAVGGELGASTAFLVEAAPPTRRGFYVSLQFFSQDAAGMIAGVIGFLLAARLSEGQLDAWGWRVAIAAGALIVPFGLMLRRSLPETLDIDEPEPSADGAPPRRAFYVAAMLIIGCGGVISYVLNYFATYAGETLHMARTAAFASTVVVGLCGVTFDIVGGLLADRYGRRRVMIWPQVALALLAVPAFMAIVAYRSPPVLLAAVALMATTNDLASTAALVAVTEAIPRRIRSGGLGLTYAIGMCAFGGSTQFVVAGLTQLTGSPMAPAWYLTGAAVLVLGAILTLPETAPFRKNLRH